MNPPSTPSMEDQFINEKVRQLLLQSVTFKQSFKFNCVMALTVDDEPPRAIIINDNFGPIDRAKAWAQTTLPLLNNIFNNNPNCVSPTTVNTSVLTNQQHELSTIPSNSMNDNFISMDNTTTAATVNPLTTPVYSSTSKRKKIKPCRIPQSNGVKLEEFDQKNALDLTKPDVRSIGPMNQFSNLNDSTDSKSKLFSGNDSSVLSNYRQNIWSSDLINPSLSEDNKSPVFPLMYPIMKEATPITSTPKKKSSNGIPGHKRSGASKVFACNQCKEQFTSLTALCKHTFSMHRAFRCNYCGANFTQRSNLQRHSLKHVGFKPFICNVCNKAYYRKDHLVRHIEVTHSEVDPKSSITVKLTSSECLDYLEKMQNSGTTYSVEEGNPMNYREEEEEEVESKDSENNYLNMPKLHMGEDPSNQQTLSPHSIGKESLVENEEENRLMIVEGSEPQTHPQYHSPNGIFPDDGSLDSTSLMNGKSNFVNSMASSPFQTAESIPEETSGRLIDENESEMKLV